MPFDFAAAKAIARQTVHDVFGVPATYQDDAVNPPVEIRARWHNKITRPMGDLDDGGYAEIIEGIDRIIFNRVRVDDELTSVVDVDGFPITLKRTGLVSFPETLPGAVFELEYREERSGPVEEIWVVTRKKQGA